MPGRWSPCPDRRSSPWTPRFAPVTTWRGNIPARRAPSPGDRAPGPTTGSPAPTGRRWRPGGSRSSPGSAPRSQSGAPPAPSRRCEVAAPAVPGTRAGSTGRSGAAAPEAVAAVAVVAVAPASAAPRSTEQRPGNHHALDLVGALIDLGDLCVSHHSLDRVVGDVAVTTEQLDAVRGHPHRHVRGEELGHRGHLGEVRLLHVRLGRCSIDQVPRRLDLCRHVGQQELDALEARDRLPELFAFLDVVQRVIESAFSDAERLRADARPRSVQHSERDLEAGALFTEPVGCGYLDVLEDDLCGGRTSDAELELELLDRPRAGLALEDEGGDS